MTLPVPLVMQELETPESYAVRLCAANGFSSYRRFLKLTKMTSSGLAKGEPEALDRLATWSGVGAGPLSKYAAVTASRYMTWRFGAAVFNKEARPGRRFRYCPCCVIGDLTNGAGPVASRPFVRLGWACRAVKNCVEHRRPLLEAPQSPVFGSDFCSFVQSNRNSIRAEAQEPQLPVSVEVDAYCESRIRGIAAEPYLDRLEAHVALDLCLHLGRFMKRHPYTLKSIPAPLRRAPAREIGFFVARQGEEGIRDLIIDIIRTQRPKGASKFLFGSLGKWLRDNRDRPEFASVLEFFQDVAERNLPYGPGETCFVAVRKRYLHTVQSASEEYGLFHRRIIQLLTEAGILDDASFSRARIYFDAEKAHEILLAASRTITSKEAATALGISEKPLMRLLKRGLLPQVEGRLEERTYTRIRREDLDGLVHNIFVRVAVGSVDENWITVDQLCARACCEKDEVIASLLAGTLKDVAAPVEHCFRLDALRFHPSKSVEYIVSTRMTLCEQAGEEVLNCKGASTYLGAKRGTALYLLSLGYLKSIMVENPAGKQRQTVVTVASLDAFLKEHVLVSEVAANHSTSTNTILHAMQSVGVGPIYDNCNNVSRFFRKADIKDAPVDIPTARRCTPRS